jgi:hypothetical protein
MKAERVVKIEKSRAKGKKYVAFVSDGKTTRRINFGATGYGQFKDSTNLKLYKSMDHGDPKRRRNYFMRHSNVATKEEALRKEKGAVITAKYLAHKYLW